MSPMITLAQLEQIYIDISQKVTGTNLDVYNYYINILKSDQTRNLMGVRSEKHHIIPKHAGGLDDQSNLILLTTKEHIIAHWLRWKAFNQIGDLAAVKFRIGETEANIDKRLYLVKMAREDDKKNNKGFFNSEFQSKMGKKGGLKGGSKNTPEQFSARQKVGLEYGKLTGKGNQGETLKQAISNYTIWSYKGEFFFVISPKETFVEKINILRDKVPNSIRSNPSFHKVIKGERKQMYGWELVKKLTSNEVMDGIKQLQNENPSTPIYLDNGALEALNFE